MKRILVVAALGLAVAGCCLFTCNGPEATAESPDGRNEIRLWTSPLAYEVVRDGVVVVARTPVGLKVDGKCLCEGAALKDVSSRKTSGTVETPVYKKAKICLCGEETFADFGDWGVRLAARNDGVAYRFETKKPGRIRVSCEKATLNIPCPKAESLVYLTKGFGSEEVVPKTLPAGDIDTKDGFMAYLPLVYTVGGKTVAFTESDVLDYPALYLTREEGAAAGVSFKSTFQKYPKTTYRAGGWNAGKEIPSGGRWVRIRESEDFLVETAGTRTFPWRTFILADRPADLCASDAVYALAAPKANYDFSWVKPGKVAWDWWNCFDNKGNEGCNTKTYERFIDFAARTGVEYVIFDEGWSETLNIWKFHKDVDVPHLIDYANGKGVGIILWMAWAQVYGEEEKVASHFAKLGAKGFKVDFMDRADAEDYRFLEKFADACARHKMVVDYHGMTRPTGMSRKYPNVLNYEGVHGLECMKFYRGEDFMANDVCSFFGRLTAGPMDYTPGAMINYPVGKYPVGAEAKKVNCYVNPGSEGTRCHQMAQMVLFEAPLQMLSDSPTNYEKNMECFSFMAATPVVWADTVGLGGCPKSYAAAARRANDGSWYAAAMGNREAHDITVDTAFLGDGCWKAEVFRDAPDSDTAAMKYVHETKSVKAGEKIPLRLAKGGGAVIRFTK